MLYVSNDRTPWGRHSDSKVISSCQGFGVGEEGVNRWHKGDFQASETILYDTIMLVTQHDTFVKTHRMCTTKTEP